MKIIDLGLVDYAKALDVQNIAVAEVQKGAGPVLILCEHPPVLTLGRSSKEGNVLFSQENLKQRGVDLISSNRGGDVTLHAPGQLVIYIILDLNYYGKDLKIYSSKLEELGIDLLSEFGIVANRFPGKTGVWVGPKKIISLGIGVKKWVTFHGLGVNVNTDLKLFSLIKPCGLDVEMTSISEIKKSTVPMAVVKEKTAEIVEKMFTQKVRG